jgi:hypothetical protein
MKDQLRGNGRMSMHDGVRGEAKIHDSIDQAFEVERGYLGGGRRKEEKAVDRTGRPRMWRVVAWLSVRTDGEKLPDG